MDRPDYMTAKQLADATGWTLSGIEHRVERRQLRLGVHYFQPGGRRGRRMYKWEAVKALIEGVELDELPAPRDGRRVNPVNIDEAIERATRLLA